VLRGEDDDFTLEPFVGSSSVAAMLGIPRKLDDAVALLRALAIEARRVADEVFVVRRREGAEEVAPTAAPVRELAAALASEPANVRVTDVMRRYRADGVELEFYAPVSFGDRPATGYFASFHVVAATMGEAEALLRAGMAEEGRIVGEPAFELVDVEDGTPAGISQLGGRSYFGG
jgi:hypothetical protein